jgi:hypothetical protein
MPVGAMGHGRRSRGRVAGPAARAYAPGRPDVEGEAWPLVVDRYEHKTFVPRAELLGSRDEGRMTAGENRLFAKNVTNPNQPWSAARIAARMTSSNASHRALGNDRSDNEFAAPLRGW